MGKKLVIAVICLIVVGFSLLACDSNNLKPNANSNRLNLKKDKISHINISSFPVRFQAFNINDTKQISTVIDYLNSINPIETNLEPKDYVGGGYLIQIHLKNNTERVFNLFGNKFFIEVDNFTYEMRYEEAIKIDTIIADILERNQEKNGESSVIGSIISVKSEASGRNISCIIKDKDNVTHSIYIGNASIIDSTGNGWMILREKDEVKVFYQRGKSLDDGSLLASTIYIKKAAR